MSVAPDFQIMSGVKFHLQGCVVCKVGGQAVQQLQSLARHVNILGHLSCLCLGIHALPCDVTSKAQENSHFFVTWLSAQT